MATARTTSTTNEPPIFVIGCPRSGTSLLRLILDSHPRISAGPETHFLIDLERIVKQYWNMIRNFGLDEAYWYSKIATFFDEFQTTYAQGRGKVRWCDKTPRYTAHLDFIDRLFPSAQYLHIIRDGYDVVASHRERWGLRSAVTATARWRNFITYAREFGKALPEHRFFELRYESLVRHPEATLRPIFDFLSEPWDLQVLDYTAVQHDRRDQSDSFMEQRRQQGKDPATIYRSRVGAGRRELSLPLRLLLRSRCRPLLEELGY